ncbi:hypothetical protein [Caulobacter sp. DWR1-3-2b1]|uniref:hypothetical protein n=1 Tax=Caulobacter sp. DWR1-3-2b1 TaxID=2804670 RepID=UPI003CFB77D6
MSTRFTSAIVLGLAIVAGPMGGASALAQTPPAATVPPTAAQLQTVIATAARTRAAQPGFAALSANQKAAALKAAIQAALSESGASESTMATALTAAANSGVIPAGLAISIAADVAPAFAQQVASGTNQSSTATASTDAFTTQSTVSVLTSLQSASTTGGDGAAPAALSQIVVAPFDPCAGVVAAYCG